MSRVANICGQTKQRGNALVLLILLKTWGGTEAPDHYELAELAHISPRQAERDLLKLVADGEVERISPEHHGGRGCKTRWQVRQTTSDMSESDKTPSDVTEFQPERSPSEVTGIPETTSDVTGLSDVNHDTLDGVSPPNPVTSDGTKVAPSKALRTSTDNKKTLSPRASVQAEPKRERETRFPLEVRKAYAAARGCGDGWLHTSRDGRYDELIEGWQQSEGTEKSAAHPSPAKPAQLSPDEVDSLISQAAALLSEGADISDVDKQFAPTCPRSQWATIRSAAQAQARVRPQAAESPPPKATNVVPLARAQR